MSTFAELKCFNKLLLNKMKRMEEHHKKQMEEQNKKYNKKQNSYESLCELVLNAPYGIESVNLHCCDLCHVWYNIDVDDDLKCICEDGGEYVCRECLSEPTCIYKRCCDCDDNIIDLDYHPTLKINNNYSCRDCYRTNLAKTINDIPDNMDCEFIRRHVHNSRRVIRELEGFSIFEIGDPYYHYEEAEF